MTKADQTQATRRALIDATMRVIRDRGIAGVSTRTIATEASVAQGLVVYHFGGVGQLVGAACLTSTQERVEAFAAQFEAVDSFAGLVKLAQDVHRVERAAGNVAVLAQALAGAQADAGFAEVTSRSLALWTDQVERVLDRLIPTSSLTLPVTAKDVAQWVAAAFVGLELFPDGSDIVDRALSHFAEVAELLDAGGQWAAD